MKKEVFKIRTNLDNMHHLLKEFTLEFRDCGAGHYQWRNDEGGVLNWWREPGTLLRQGRAETLQHVVDALKNSAKRGNGPERSAA